MVECAECGRLIADPDEESITDARIALSDGAFKALTSAIYAVIGYGDGSEEDPLMILLTRYFQVSYAHHGEGAGVLSERFTNGSCVSSP